MYNLSILKGDKNEIISLRKRRDRKNLQRVVTFLLPLLDGGKRFYKLAGDPKHDSTFTLSGFLIPTIIDTLQSKDYHYEDVWPEDVIYQGYGGVDCVEAGGPPAGAGCGGYVVGETVKL